MASSSHLNYSEKIFIVDGNIFHSEEDFICHQCNCVTRSSKGLANEIFRIYPTADTYKKRFSEKDYDTPGTIYVDPFSKIINLYAQYSPGKIESKRSVKDTKKQRLEWFEECLKKLILFSIEKEKHYSFAFPFMIGCGLAGGNWDDYYQILKRFSKHKNIKKVIIYSLK